MSLAQINSERRIENKKTPLIKTPTEKETFSKKDPNGERNPGAELKIYSGDASSPRRGTYSD